MKVVLFCGGKGTRMNDPHGTPKPLVKIGTRPLLWHIMKYYAHYGHKDFILCLGHQAEKFKEYFLSYDECDSNDFVWSHGGRKIEPLSRDTDDWRITFVETGAESNLGTRLLAVRRFLGADESFLANYSDGLTDCPLPDLVRRHHASGAVATFMSAPPAVSFHFVHSEPSGAVSDISAAESAELWVNAGFFVFRHDIFDYIRPGEELVLAPFQRLIKRRLLQAVRHTGFWQPVDTNKDLQTVTEMARDGIGPWEVWRHPILVPDEAAPDFGRIVRMPVLAS